MRQTIIDNLNKLFTGVIDTVKITYHTPKSHDVIKFEMLGHEIHEEDDMITVYDSMDNQSIPKTVNIDPSIVEDITYEDGKADGLKIYEKKVIISMSDGSRIEMCTVGWDKLDVECRNIEWWMGKLFRSIYHFKQIGGMS